MNAEKASGNNGIIDDQAFNQMWDELFCRVMKRLKNNKDEEMTSKEAAEFASVLERIQKGKASAGKETADPLKGFIKAINRAKKDLSNGL